MISGDRGGQGVGPSLPINLFGNVASKNRRTCEPQGGVAQSETLLTEVQRKVPTCPSNTFVCNQGKTLCSLCILIFFGNSIKSLVFINEG